jgi:uncharacterized surface protein with fasciclin (FAS1) repeats
MMRFEQENMMPQTRFARAALIAISAAAFTLAPAALAQADKRADHHGGGHGGAMSQTIVGAAAANSNFSTLVAAVQAAGLVDTLNGPGPFTVFAPTNDAFGTLPEGTVATLLRPENRAQLQRVLTYHVVAGRVSAADVAAAVRRGRGHASFTTVAGARLTARRDSHGGLILVDEQGGRARITATDLNQSNGVIHVIDRVVLPR